MSEYVMEFSEEIEGVPTMGLVQAKNYKFKVSKDIFMITVPMQGSYHALDPEFFNEASGDFVVFDGKDLNVATLSKVLFATRSYPNLEDNQLFCPLKFSIAEDNIVIYGQVVQIGGTLKGTNEGN